MSAPLLEDSDDIEFLRFKPRGKVHVLLEYRSPFDAFEDGDPEAVTDDDEGQRWLDYLFAAQVSRCGVRGEAGTTNGVSDFDDGDLCWRCYTSVPEGDRQRLFERW
jgi:hypothetical protein